MTKVLVTGANGFIGSALCRRLLADGVDVRAMCRNPAKGKPLAEAGAEMVGGDIQDLSAVERYCQGCEVVHHVAAVGNGDFETQRRINVQGTRNVIQAARRAGVGRFVHVSTIAIYGTVNGLIDESYEPHPTRYDFYGQTKAEGERAVWDYAAQTGLPTVSVRPAFVYGPGSSLWSKALYDICRRYPMPLIDGGRSNAHPIYVDDVVDLLVTAAQHPDAPGKAFHAAPDPAVSWREYFGCYAQMAGRTSSISIPSSLAIPISDLFTTITRGHPHDIAGSVRFWASRATFSMKRAADVLGWQPKIPLADGMARTERWLKGTA